MIEPNREAAYAALVDALIALRRDPATERFDEYLTHAQQTGRIDEPTARALRWWQRESLRGVQEHLETLLPGLLGQLERADEQARRAVDMSDQAWRSAAGQDSGTSTPTPETPLPKVAADEPTTPEPVEPEPVEPEPVEPAKPPYSTQAEEELLPAVGAPEHRTITAGLTVLTEE